jgi:DNA-binding GntR family transcriptional regulator
VSVARQEQPPFLTKRDYAHVELRRRILDGALAPGTRLLLRPIAEELGVSVMPVRDAIRLLERDGLVTVENHRGATVTQIPRETVVESVGIRMWLEVLAVREATPSHTAQTLATAERALGEAEGAAASGQPLAYAHANRAVHRALEAAAADPLRQLIEELWDRFWQVRRSMSLFVIAPQRIAAAESEHREIFEAIRSGDAEAAARAMAVHRDNSLAAWETALRPARSRPPSAGAR